MSGPLQRNRVLGAQQQRSAPDVESAQSVPGTTWAASLPWHRMHTCRSIPEANTLDQRLDPWARIAVRVGRELDDEHEAASLEERGDRGL